jgi:putative phosphonate catabolism associated alcohol dehydrogenase
MKDSLTAVFHSANNPILLENLSIPELKQGEIRIRNEFVSLCKSDIHTFVGKRIEKTPTILGHEVVGIIEEFGPGETIYDVRNQKLRKGDLVSWAIFSSSPDSPLALEGIPQKGADLFKYGHEQLRADNTLHGGLSEYIILRKNTPIAKVNSQIPRSVLSLINCSVATISGAIRLLGDIKNKHFLITGAGMLGLTACAMLRTLGAQTISVLESNKERLQQSKHFGATYLFETMKGIKEKAESIFDTQNPFNGLIETTGASGIMEDSLETLKIGGIAIWIGAVFPERKINLDSEKIIRNLWVIKGLHNYNIQDFIRAVDFMERNHALYPFKALVEKVYPLEEVNDAFKFASNQNAIRVGIHFSNEEK